MSVTWTCQPFKKEVGDTCYSVSASEASGGYAVPVGGHVPSYPVVYCKANGAVTITIGDISMTINGDGGEYYLDCENKLTYRYVRGVMTFVGDHVNMNSAEWFELSPDDMANNQVKVSGGTCTDLKIWTNWRWF